MKSHSISFKVGTTFGLLIVRGSTFSRKLAAELHATCLLPKRSHADILLAVYSTPSHFPSLAPHKAGIKLYPLSKNRRAATGCPLSTFGVVSGVDLHSQPGVK